MTIDVDPVLNPLRTIETQGFSRHTVFRDWVRLMLAALQRDDDQYLEILETYDRGERVAERFAHAFSELLTAMAESNRDLLGSAYEGVGMQTDAFGQHFTSHPVVAEMVELQAAVDDPEPPVTIADLACGSERLLILAARKHNVPRAYKRSGKLDVAGNITIVDDEEHVQWASPLLGYADGYRPGVEWYTAMDFVEDVAQSPSNRLCVECLQELTGDENFSPNCGYDLP